MSVACGPYGTIYVSVGHSPNEIKSVTVNALGVEQSSSQLASIADSFPASADGGPDNVALGGAFMYVSEQSGSHVYRVVESIRKLGH